LCDLASHNFWHIFPDTLGFEENENDVGEEASSKK